MSWLLTDRRTIGPCCDDDWSRGHGAAAWNWPSPPSTEEAREHLREAFTRVRDTAPSMMRGHAASIVTWGSVLRRTVALILLTVMAMPVLAQTATRPTARQQRQPSRRRPPPPPNIQWMMVAAGSSHTCALDLTGQAYCWGDNAWRRLGITDSVNMRRPVKVETPQRFRLVSAGTTETCAVTDRGGGIVCWGGAYPGTLPRTVLADRSYDRITLRGNTCAISSDGNGWCWGSNGVGQLGSGSPSTETAASPQPLAGGLRWHTVDPAIGGFACGLTDAGVAMCWGANGAGQLGTGGPGDSRTPATVSGAPRYQALAIGGEHACGLDAEGGAWCWGNGQHGALGAGTRDTARAPQRVRGPQRWTQLVAGYHFTCGLDDAGKAWCWGRNSAGVLGTGNRTDRDVPAAVRTGRSFTFLSAGDGHVCGISDRRLYCWGDNTDGQLGIARARTCRNEVAPGRYDVRQCVMVPTLVQEPR